MPASHKKHLKKYGYKPGKNNVDMMYDPKLTQDAYQRLAAQWGENNVWDSRIVDKAFDTAEASILYGMLVNVVHKETDERGSLLSTINLPGVPKFYYGFERID